MKVLWPVSWKINLLVSPQTFFGRKSADIQYTSVYVKNWLQPIYQLGSSLNIFSPLHFIIIIITLSFPAFFFFTPVVIEEPFKHEIFGWLLVILPSQIKKKMKKTWQKKQLLTSPFHFRNQSILCHCIWTHLSLYLTMCWEMSCRGDIQM